MNINNLDIVYEDEFIIAINKPSGIATVPDRYDRNAIHLAGMLKEKYGIIFPVHRLDRETSGIIIFAKDADTHRALNTQFQERTVKKIYHAVVSGVVEQEEMDIDIPIMNSPAKPGTSVPSARGKASLTKIKVIERYRIATLLECNLITGRHHQIRVHCAAIGHPLLVDGIYGRLSEFYLSTIKRRYNIKKGEEEKPIISRLSLHANSVTIYHPQLEKEMEFTATWQKDLLALRQLLNKYSGLIS